VTIPSIVGPGDFDNGLLRLICRMAPFHKLSLGESERGPPFTSAMARQTDLAKNR
jgi:hypothetical protein